MIVTPVASTFPFQAPDPILADMFAFLQEVPLAFIIGFVTVCLILVSKYLLPR